MARTYAYLKAEDKSVVDKEVSKRESAVKEAYTAVTKEMMLDWEKVHYEHSVLLKKATTADAKKVHTDAMETIEADLAKAEAK